MSRKTLGKSILSWMTAYLAAPDRADYEPFRPTIEQAQFIINFYELDPKTGRRLKRRAVYSRAKGSGKSPLLAAIALAEALAPVLFDHWAAKGEVSDWGYEYTKGEPVGKGWATVRKPWVQVAAVSEDQTRNCWDPLLDMVRHDEILDAFPGLEPLETFVNLPMGRIEYVTSSAMSREGNRPVFCVLDQTEGWVASNGGIRLAATMRRNLGKTGGTSIESPNAFVPGEESVAEASASYAELVAEGKARDRGFLYDHREAPADTDLGGRDSLIAGLRYAYGCSVAGKCVLPGHTHKRRGWIDLDRIVAEIWDPDTDPQDARRYYLNQITHASDSLVSQPEWAACKDETKKIQPKDVITLGFDGSRGRARGKPDATALIGCRVEDGHLFEIRVWEAADGPGQEKWVPPLVEIDAAIDEAFRTYTVVAFYADPAKDWRSKVNEWEAKYSGGNPRQRLAAIPVKVTKDHPFEWWMTGGRSLYIERAIEAFEGAVRNRELTHSGTFALTSHVLNARRRIRRQKLAVGKAHDYSPKKIDACVAAILAWQARLDAITAGIGTKPKRSAPVRVR